jgi:AcrR family transcriptional regulator
MPEIVRKTADARKAEILATVLRLADEVGPDRLTTKAVADAIGISQPAIFRHFPTKQALWQAVAHYIEENMTASWDTVLKTTQDPQDRIIGLIRVQLRQIETHPAIPAILNSRELHTGNIPLRGCFLGLMQQFQATLTSELARAQQMRVFHQNHDPKDAAILLISLVQGMAIRWSLGTRGFALETEGARLLDVQIQLLRIHPEPKEKQ